MKSGSSPWPCTDHQYVTDPRTRRIITRGCVDCSEARWLTRLKAAFGMKHRPAAQTPAQAANAESWREINETPQPQLVK
jgi:hypothetical protein